MDNEAGINYLSSFLGKTLRIQLTPADGRIFVGQMKCTDKVRPVETVCFWRSLTFRKDSNIILSNTHEHRENSRASCDKVASIGASDNHTNANITSRFVGLVVVPGEHIQKIEVEEFDPDGII